MVYRVPMGKADSGTKWGSSKGGKEDEPKGLIQRQAQPERAGITPAHANRGSSSDVTKNFSQRQGASNFGDYYDKIWFRCFPCITNFY